MKVIQRAMCRLWLFMNSICTVLLFDHAPAHSIFKKPCWYSAHANTLYILSNRNRISFGHLIQTFSSIRMRKHSLSRILISLTASRCCGRAPDASRQPSLMYWYTLSVLFLSVGFSIFYFMHSFVFEYKTQYYAKPFLRYSSLGGSRLHNEPVDLAIKLELHFNCFIFVLFGFET